MAGGRLVIAGVGNDAVGWDSAAMAGATDSGTVVAEADERPFIKFRKSKLYGFCLSICVPGS